jgi:hypothetical protein
MLRVLFEARQRVILVRYGGIVTADDLIELEASARRFVQNCEPVPVIVDLSDVSRITVPTGFVVALAQQPPIMAGQSRVYVVLSPETFGLVRLFATYQEIAGFRPPKIVRTLYEAQQFLDLDQPEFAPLSRASS